MSAPFHLYSRGQRFEGTYEVDARTLTIRTAFGTRRAALGMIKPLKLAKTLYRTLLRDVAAAPAPLAPGALAGEAPRLHRAARVGPASRASASSPMIGDDL